MSALTVPHIVKSNQRACVAFEAFLAAADRDDPTAAGLAWTKQLQDAIRSSSAHHSATASSSTWSTSRGTWPRRRTASQRPP